MMEENKIPEELGGNSSVGAAESVQATAVADVPSQTSETPDMSGNTAAEAQVLIDVPDLPPQKSKSKFPVALISVVAVLLMVMVGAFASGIIANPERAVRTALTATGEAMDKRVEQIENEIPMMKETAYTGTPAPSNTTFSFTFDSLTGDSIPPEAGFIVNMLKGIGVQGSYTNDPAGLVDELDAALALNGTDLFSLYAFSSPEQLAFSLPSVMETGYSINPKTFSADIRESPLYGLLGLTPDDIAEAQEMLDEQYSAAESLDDLDYQQMQADIRAIFGKAIEKAEFKSAGRKDGLKSYTVAIPGEDMKAVMIELVRYVYLESSFQNMFKTAMEPTLAYEGMTYEEYIKSMVVEPLESLPDLPATLTLGINKTIKTARLDIIPDTSIGTGVDVIDSIGATFARADNGDLTLQMNFNGMLSAEPFSMSMDIVETYADGAYAFDIGGTVDSSEIGMTFKETMNFDKAGAAGLSLGFDFSGNGINGAFNADFSGTIKADGDKTVYDFPSIVLHLNADDVGDYTANFKLKAETVPVQTPITPVRDSKPVLAMSESELEADLTKLSESLEALESTFAGAFGMSGLGNPFAMSPAA